MEIAFLIRIKEGVRQLGLECEAFAMRAADALLMPSVQNAVRS